MARLDFDAEAASGSLDPATHNDLVLIQRFLAARDAAIMQVFGPSAKSNPVRDSITRNVLVESGYGRVRNIAFYQRASSRSGSPSRISNEIDDLVVQRLLIKRPDQDNHRVALIAPTIRLVQLYAHWVPMLGASLSELFEQRSRPNGVDSPK